MVSLLMGEAGRRPGQPLQCSTQLECRMRVRKQGKDLHSPHVLFCVGGEAIEGSVIVLSAHYACRQQVSSFWGLRGLDFLAKGKKCKGASWRYSHFGLVWSYHPFTSVSVEDSSRRAPKATLFSGTAT